MHPGSQPPPDDTALVIFLGIGFLIAGIIYVLPTILALTLRYEGELDLSAAAAAFKAFEAASASAAALAFRRSAYWRGFSGAAGASSAPDSVGP